MDIPEEITRLIDLLNAWEFRAGKQTSASRAGWRLLDSILERHGFRWEYFV